MRRFLACIAMAVALAGSATAQDKTADAPKADGYKFTDIKTVKSTSVKNQFRSGTCWCFSTLSFLEEEIMRAGGEEMDLSEMWIVRNIYFEKAVKYVRLQGAMSFSVGGAAHDVLHGIEQYGIVPQEVYEGQNYGTKLPYFNEIDAVLKAYVDAIITAPNETLTTAWQSGLNGILDAYFGVMPEKFTYKGKEYTPKSFAASLPIKMSDYIDLASFTHHPFYEEFILEVPDNWLWGKYYNLPLEEMMQTIDNALANGYSIAWGTDVSEKGFSRQKGVAVIPDEEVDSISGTDAERWGKLSEEEKSKALYRFDNPVKEKTITQQMRQEAFDNYQTTDDHGMVIVGTATDQTGAPFYRVKNSWGVRPPYDGYLYASRQFVEYKTMDITVNKKAVPKEILKKLGVK